MAAKKTTGKKKSSGTKNNTKNNTKKNIKTQPEEQVKEPSHLLATMVPVVLVMLAIFMLVCYFIPNITGVIGTYIKEVANGLFSGASYSIPVILVFLAIYFKKDYEESYIGYRILFSAGILVNLAVILHGISGDCKTFNPVQLYNSGTELQGGGVVGGIIGSLLHKLIGPAGLLIISIPLFVVCTIFLFGLTPKTIAKYISYYFHEKKEQRNQKLQEQELYFDKPEAYLPDDYDAEVDNFINPHAGDIDPNDLGTPSFEELLAENNTYEPIPEKKNTKNKKAKKIDSLNDVIEEISTDDFVENESTEIGKKKFSNQEGLVNPDLSISDTDDSIEEDLEIDNTPITDETIEIIDTPNDEVPPEENEEKEVKEPIKPKKPKKYIFPPINLLDDVKQEVEVNNEELQEKAVKLVETLASFKVKTKIVDIAHGPTITRYELAPEEGVRVRTISNLVDDIALSLATSGVRIEAPIPGKAAVGIEVPNKQVSTVHLRKLLETQDFKSTKSKIAVALGMDVAGTPIILDIAKMPHLLIAGATGMGKSVCINSMIISLLYKASPEEVKVILIDPKKVEFNIYKGLPHLPVPVVNDPKKAAGTLQWAVNEMERRFELIESVGVRDIYNFNMMTKDDPTYEYMPHIVIIIDELADLMMMAPDSVEDSICRLAQKARAAGMHLIIGTQRPSVDVITGLIKANVPSRIAFTVASQVDSRTIIDIAGAEKLIGRGDMLYAPVGAPKPMRVQGAFVSEKEVERIVEFIKEKSGNSDYDESIVEEINKEADKCTTKKSSSIDINGGDSGDTDPMLDKAIELAVDSGKISTSLIQRRLSLGYGRAAKLIDIMQEMGIVGEQEGNKPRSVLMTRQEYTEMIINKSNNES